MFKNYLALLLALTMACPAWAIERNVASQKITVTAIDRSTGGPKTGDAGNITVYVSKDDGTLTALGDTSATEISSTNAPGSYLFDLTQSETSAGKLLFTGKSGTSNVDIVPQTLYTTPEGFSTLSIANNATAANITYAGGTAIKAAGGYLHALDASKGPVLYVFHDGNNTTSGDTLRSVLSGASAGSTVYVGPGKYAMGTNQLIQPDYTRLIGAGIDVTVITSTIASATPATSCYRPGSQSLSSDFTFQSLNADPSLFDYPVGICGAYNGGTETGAITNATLRRMRIIGLADAIMVGHSTACSLECEDLICESGYDCFAGYGQTAHELKIRNCFSIVTEANSQGIGRGCSWSGRVKAVGLHVIARARPSLATTTLIGIQVPSSGRGEFIKSSVLLIGTAATDNISVQGSASSVSTAMMVDCEYDRTKTSGNVFDTFSPLRQTAPGTMVSNTPTADITATGAIGIDLANVENPTTTLNLSGTTVSTSQQVASVTGAVGSVTGNVGGNVAGSVASVTALATNALSAASVSQAAAEKIGAEGGGGTPAQVHNEEPVAAFTAKLGSRADGVVKAYPVLKLTAREGAHIWIDCSKLTNTNLGNVTNAVSDDTDVAEVTDQGMIGKYISIVLDTSGASPGDTATISGDCSPVGPWSVDVEIKSP